MLQPERLIPTHSASLSTHCSVPCGAPCQKQLQRAASPTPTQAPG